MINDDDDNDSANDEDDDHDDKSIRGQYDVTEGSKDDSGNNKDDESVWTMTIRIMMLLLVTGVWISLFQDARQTGEQFSIVTHQVRKQVAKNIERVSEREKENSADWRVGLYFYSPILLAFGELASGYPHPCCDVERNDNDDQYLTMFLCSLLQQTLWIQLLAGVWVLQRLCALRPRNGALSRGL
jgi:hypothetical protein